MSFSEGQVHTMGELIPAGLFPHTGSRGQDLQPSRRNLHLGLVNPKSQPASAAFLKDEVSHVASCLVWNAISTSHLMNTGQSHCQCRQDSSLSFKREHRKFMRNFNRAEGVKERDQGEGNRGGTRCYSG